jgi:hypothetical protein
MHEKFNLSSPLKRFRYSLIEGLVRAAPGGKQMVRIIHLL